MGNNLKQVEELYNNVSGEYAEAFSGEHWKKPMDQEILRRFSREMGSRGPVWDFGCGPGQTSKFLKDLGVKISGMDLSEKMLKHARKICPGIHFRKGNILKPEYEDNSIAGIVSFYAMVHLTQKQVNSALCEVFRILQPGGIFLLAYHIGDKSLRVKEFLGKTVDIEFMFFTTEFISGCLKKIGFKKIETIEREPYADVEFKSRRAYVFAYKPEVNSSNLPGRRT